MCLVCLETLSAMKDFNLSRHYNTLHKAEYEKYTEAARAAMVADLKSKVHKQQRLFTRATTTQESALRHILPLHLSSLKRMWQVEGCSAPRPLNQHHRCLIAHWCHLLNYCAPSGRTLSLAFTWKGSVWRAPVVCRAPVCLVCLACFLCGHSQVSLAVLVGLQHCEELASALCCHCRL